MESQTDNPLFLPSWELGNLTPYLSNPDTINGLTEEFPQTERFCTRVPQQQTSMTTLYGHDQSAYNQQCADICRTLLQVLINTNGDPQRLQESFAPCHQVLCETPSSQRNGLDLEHIQENVLVTLTETSAEKFFSFITYFRHLLAAASPQREDRWHEFGENRYDDDSEQSLPTPLLPERYQPSVTRGRNGVAFQDYLSFVEERQRSGLQNSLQSNKIGQDVFNKKLEKFKQENVRLQSFDIRKNFNGEPIVFAKIVEWETLLNLKLAREVYVTIYNYIDILFVNLFAQELLPVETYLRNIFRIQFWFIHVMPYRRGSLAVMNFFRYILTAYYNYRARQLNRPPLPMVPARVGYFPDLEALFCCRTEDDFVDGSMTTYYCVDYNAYCVD